MDSGARLRAVVAPVPQSQSQSGMSQGTLANAELGRAVLIEAVELDRQAASWLAAVGLHEGEELVVLRRAIFGGPLHVRTSSGGEFAIARELATQILVRDARAGEGAE